MFTGKAMKMGTEMDMRTALMVRTNEQHKNMPETHIFTVTNHGLTTAGI